MKISGIVFDFNGTLLWDTHLHNEAWDKFLNNHDIFLSDDEKLRILHGKNNELIIEELFKGKLSSNQVSEIIMEKEFIYQENCRNHKIGLAPGVISFLNFLKTKNISYTIATASGKENVDFYFDYLKLSAWFKKELVSFNDGTIKSKPNPELFIKAIEKLGVPPSETIIFEDSISGIQAAENAGAGKLIIVNSFGFDYSAFPHEVITNFDMVDRSQFY